MIAAVRQAGRVRPVLRTCEGSRASLLVAKRVRWTSSSSSPTAEGTSGDHDCRNPRYGRGSDAKPMLETALDGRGGYPSNAPDVEDFKLFKRHQNSAQKNLLKTLCSYLGLANLEALHKRFEERNLEYDNVARAWIRMCELDRDEKGIAVIHEAFAADGLSPMISHAVAVDMIDAYGRMQNQHAAQQVFDTMRSKCFTIGASESVSLLIAYARSRDVEGLQDCIHELERYHPGEQLSKVLVEELILQGRVNEVRPLCQLLVQEGMTLDEDTLLRLREHEDTWFATLKRAKTESSRQSSTWTRRATGGMEGNRTPLNTSVQKRGRMGREGQLMTLLREASINDDSNATEILKRIRDHSDRSAVRGSWRPDEVHRDTVTDAIRTLVDMGECRRGYNVLREFHRTGKTCSDRNVYGKVMAAMTRAGQPRETLKLYRELQKIDADRIRTGKVRTTSKHMALLAMTAAVRCTEYEEVKSIHRFVREEFGACVQSWTNLINAHARQGDIAGVETALREMEASKVTPDQVTIVSVMQAYIVQGKHLDAMAIAYRMAEEHDIQWNHYIYVSVMHAHVCRGDVDTAEALLNHMQRPGSGFKKDELIPAYNVVMNGYAKRGDVQNACRVFQTMERHGVKVQIEAISSMMHASAQAGDVDGAVSWLEEAQRRGIRLDVPMYCTLIDSFVRSGELEGAIRAYDSMQNQALRANLRIRTTILNACGKLQNLEKAQNVFLEIKKDGLGLENVVYSAMMEAHLRCSDFMGALEVYQEMVDRNIEADEITLLKYARAHEGLGSLDDATAELETMIAQTNDDRERFWIALMDIHGRRSDVEAYEKTVDRLRKDESIAKLSPSFFQMGIMSCIRCGRIERAQEHLVEMIRDEEATSPKQLQKLTRWTGTLDYADWTIRELELRGMTVPSLAYENLVGTLCTKGDFASALRVATSMGIRASTHTFHPIVMGLASSGDLSAAREALQAAVTARVAPKAEWIAATTSTSDHEEREKSGNVVKKKT